MELSAAAPSSEQRAAAAALSALGRSLRASPSSPSSPQLLPAPSPLLLPSPAIYANNPFGSPPAQVRPPLASVSVLSALQRGGVAVEAHSSGPSVAQQALPQQSLFGALRAWTAALHSAELTLAGRQGRLRRAALVLDEARRVLLAQQHALPLPQAPPDDAAAAPQWVRALARDELEQFAMRLADSNARLRQQLAHADATAASLIGRSGASALATENACALASRARRARLRLLSRRAAEAAAAHDAAATARVQAGALGSGSSSGSGKGAASDEAVSGSSASGSSGSMMGGPGDAEPDRPAGKRAPPPPPHACSSRSQSPSQSPAAHSSSSSFFSLIDVECERSEPALAAVPAMTLAVPSAPCERNSDEATRPSSVRPMPAVEADGAPGASQLLRRPLPRAAAAGLLFAALAEGRRSPSPVRGRSRSGCRSD